MCWFKLFTAKHQPSQSHSGPMVLFYNDIWTLNLSSQFGYFQFWSSRAACMALLLSIGFFSVILGWQIALFEKKRLSRFWSRRGATKNTRWLSWIYRQIRKGISIGLSPRYIGLIHSPIRIHMPVPASKACFDPGRQLHLQTNNNGAIKIDAGFLHQSCDFTVVQRTGSIQIPNARF